MNNSHKLMPLLAGVVVIGMAAPVMAETKTTAPCPTVRAFGHSTVNGLRHGVHTFVPSNAAATKLFAKVSQLTQGSSYPRTCVVGHHGYTDCDYPSTNQSPAMNANNGCTYNFVSIYISDYGDDKHAWVEGPIEVQMDAK